MIDGLRVSGYRSFGSEVEISDLARINVFIGKNNCGKSNVLRFVKHIENQGCLDPRQPSNFDSALDLSIGTSGNGHIDIQVQIKQGGFTAAVFAGLIQLFEKVQLTLPYEFRDCVWFGFHSMNGLPTESSRGEWIRQLLAMIPSDATALIRLSQVMNCDGGGPEQRAAEIASRLHNEFAKIKLKVHMIDAFRKLTDEGDSS